MNQTWRAKTLLLVPAAALVTAAALSRASAGTADLPGADAAAPGAPIAPVAPGAPGAPVAPGASAASAEAEPVPADEIGIVARDLTAWREGSTWCYLFEGEARAVQGDRTLVADGMVVWFDEMKARNTGVAEVQIYAAGKVVLFLGDAVMAREEAFVRWRTRGAVNFEARRRRRMLQRAGNPLFLAARRARREILRAEREKPPRPTTRPARPIIQFFPLTREGYRTHTLPPSPGSDYRTVVITGGVDVVYNDPQRELEIELTARRMVIWRRGSGADRGDTAPRGREEIEVYAEGDVTVFAMGGTLRAPRVYYNLTTGQMLMLDARVESYSKARKVPVIYEARRVRRFGKKVLTAQEAAFTTCTFGRPHYSLSSRRVTLTEQPARDLRGRPMRDARGRPVTHQVATSWENTLRIAGVPFFYLPYVEHDLARPETGVRRVRVRYDNDYGFQVLTEEDLFYFLSFLLGSPPAGTDLRLRLDYMSERGLAAGVDAEYDQGSYLGYLRSYFLRDRGLDEGDFEPPTRDRGRILWRHRQELSADALLQAEFSWISDEAFLNEYFEREFREGKDQETVLYLKKQRELWAATALLKARVNDWQSETDYLPRFTFSLLGLPLFDDTATLISRSEIGVVRLARGDPERLDLAPVPDAQEATIFRAETRNELYRPFSWWILRVDPFVQGRLGYFGRRAGDLVPVTRVLPDGTTVTETGRGPTRSGAARASAAAGVRLSTQFWRVYEHVKSRFWNIDRLRHVITPSLTYFDLFALNVDSEELVQCDAVDDVDLLRVLDFKLRQRLQTHRGVGEKRRVIDWVTLDLTASAFPDAGRDNRGETLDNLAADLQWRLTDVVSLVSEAEYDPQADQLGTFSVGLGLDQAPRYSLFIGHRFINASDSSATTFNTALQLSEKWRLDWLVQYDWGVAELLQNRVRLSRDLHDFILHVGVRQDRSRDNTILFLEVIPKGLPELALRFR